MLLTSPPGRPGMKHVVIDHPNSLRFETSDGFYIEGVGEKSSQVGMEKRFSYRDADKLSNVVFSYE